MRFCSQCGAHLSPGKSLATEPLSEADLPASEEDPWLRLIDEHENAILPATATALRITVARTGRYVLLLFPIGDVELGRSDPSSGIDPDVDLARDGGFVEGVSRRHAKITQTGNRVLVEDVGSTNGTFLNGKRIRSHLGYALREDDSLQLGGLELRIGFE
jgi:pSer/pThr/pTyr-binding forkhead associated (FHA) protein